MPEQLEVEIALRDSISTGLRQVGREIDAITRKMKEGGDSGTDAFGKFGKGAKEAKDAADKAKEAAGGLAGTMVGMSRVLMGATGVAAGFYAVGEALEKISQKRVAMQNLGTDLGFTTEKISLMQRALERMGIEAGDQNKIITNFGHTLKDVFRLQDYSSVMTELRRMSEFDFATKLQGMVNAGADLDESMTAVARNWQKLIDMGKPQAAKYFADIFSIPESVLKNLAEGTKGIKAGYQIDYDIAQEHLKNMLEFEHSIKDVTAVIEEKVMEAYNAGFRLLKAFDWRGLIPFITPSGPEKKGDITKEPKKMGTFGLQDSGDLPMGGVADYVERGMRDEDKKTNRLLGEIADTLKIFESRTTGGGGGGAQTSSGGLGRGLDLSGRPSSPSYHSPGGGSGSFSGSGAPSGGGGVLSLPPSSGGRPAGPSAFQGAPGLGRHAAPAGAQSQSGSVLSHAQSAPVQTELPMPSSGGVMNRSNLVAEMQANPDLARRLQTIVQGEVGHGASDQRKQIQLETIFNRATARGQSLAQVTKEYTGRGSDGYYPRSTFTGGRIKNEEEFRQFQEKIMGPVKEGSDLSTERFGFPATGNASGGVASRGIASGRYNRHAELGGETYVQQENSRQVQRLLDSRGGSGGGDPGRPVGMPRAGGSSFDDDKEFITSRGGHEARLGKGDTVAPFNPELAARLAAAGRAYEARTGKKANYGEMSRSVELQSHYYNKYKAGTGGIAAPPGRSRHGFGNATDVPSGGFLNYLHGEGGKEFGLHPPVFKKTGKDRVHIEMDPSYKGSSFADRASVDGSLKRKSGGAAGAKGNVKAEIDFSPLPTKTKSGDEEGKFKLLKLNANPQGAKDSEGMLHPGDTAHTPYVP